MELPVIEFPDSVCSIEMRLLINEEGRVCEIIDFRTSLAENRDYLLKWVSQLPALRKAYFNDMPIEYSLTLPLFFYNGKNLMGRRSRPDKFISTEFGNKFWIAEYRLNRPPPGDPLGKIVYNGMPNNNDSTSSITKQGIVFFETIPEFPGGEKALREFFQLQKGKGRVF